MSSFIGHVVVAGYNHETNKYLAFVIEGDIEMDAVVNLRNPHLELFIPEQLIETGNSLAWMFKEELTTPGLRVEDAFSQPYNFIH
ncbi:hypothetical protein BK764_13480 [Bacillus thuringiensis serovar israelensis]|nr:hypothetical protein ATN07_32600 [Bacillus thuringiensis serovar israelensis]EAO56677.1 hypothetical protein RBTH_07291 [Bacillus thuringiensis serovar israelensis ATCC 35646]EEM99316.1 hypothetical protein bthur0014_58220 [Bacillus thuringiensis IBL 4222]KAA8486637.1 hypothetical protein FYW98_18315 [Bacillus thuringiensis]KRD76706.1 hypothetical protein ASE53_19760 [Bacillus sp. Root11]KRD82391.1 hypothetical protein ASE54_20600 [Bacillus sp. Root131]OTX79301.1 hypothetical protein BK719